MNVPNLGSLRQVGLRECWKDEAYDFTPWLAENIELLGDALGVKLEVTSQERAVGPYSADIVCRDVSASESEEDHVVVIENQLEKTDHSHLGQSITYAAGLEAKTVIWVAKQFTSEHRAAIDWLNELGGGVSFFGIEIELWRIGDSDPAPKFQLVSSPNDWSRSMRASPGGRALSETKRLQLEFWTEYKSFIDESGGLRCYKATPQYSMLHHLGLVGFRLYSIFSSWDSVKEGYGGEIRVDLVIDNESSDLYFHALQEQKEEIESQLETDLVWSNPEETKRARISAQESIEYEDRCRWPEYRSWLKEKSRRFYEVFRKAVPPALDE